MVTKKKNKKAKSSKVISSRLSKLIDSKQKAKKEEINYDEIIGYANSWSKSSGFEKLNHPNQPPWIHFT